jgi:AcrR family transcriptional regulator
MPAKATSASTRDNILSAATEVFTRYGYEGGSLEKISKSAKSVDRMVYYYFGSKEGLFIQVLENSYRRMNDAELALVLDPEQPVASLKGVIDLSPRGEVIIDQKGETSMPGVFAAGDCTTVPFKQIIIAMGEGAKASLSAFDYLIRS